MGVFCKKWFGHKGGNPPSPPSMWPILGQTSYRHILQTPPPRFVFASLLTGGSGSQELTEQHRKIVEEYERLHGLVEVFNKTSEHGIKVAFQGITPGKFLAMCGLNVDIPTPDSVIHPLKENLIADATAGGAAAGGKGAKEGDKDKGEKQQMQMQSLMMNLNKQNNVLSAIHEQLPSLVRAKDDEISSLKSTLAKMKVIVQGMRWRGGGDAGGVKRGCKSGYRRFRKRL